MKHKGFTIACMSIVAASALATTPTGKAAWVGVWNAELDGQPSVTLTMADDAGALEGTVVFNLIKKEAGQARVAGSTTHVLMHPHLDGSTLSFRVVRPSDSRELQMTVTLQSETTAQLRCLNCGPDSPVAQLLRNR